MRGRRWLFAVCALLAALLLARGAHASGADWDDDDDDFMAPQQKSDRLKDAAGKVFDAVDKEAEKAAARIRAEERRHAKFKNYPPMFEWRYEGIGLVIIGVPVRAAGVRAARQEERGEQSAQCEQPPSAPHARRLRARG